MNKHAMNPKVGLPPTTIQPLQCEQIYQTSGLSNCTDRRSSTVWVGFCKVNLRGQ